MFQKGARLVFAAVFAVGFLFAPLARGAVDFKKYDEALALAAAEDKHVMLYFWADWCQYCARFNSEVLPDEKVGAFLGTDFFSVMINIDEEPELAAKYDARTLPMVVFLDSSGKVAGFLPGFLPPAEFLGILKFVKDKAYLQKK
jgi:thioredoxin-related protein